jgi:hypothetical protein
MDRGLALVAAGLLLLVVGFGASAFAAPGQATPTETSATDGTQTSTGDPQTNGTDQTATRTPAQLSGTLVGVQGSGGYTSGGYTELAGERVLRDEQDTYFDVSLLRDGRLLAAWMDEDREECGPYESPCARTGFVVFEQDGTVTQRYSFPVRSSTNSEVHDVEALPDGGFVFADMDRERVVIVRDGEAVWQWNASSVYDAPADATQRDWLHINDVDRIGDGRFLVSVRNANQLLVLERQEEGGEVVEVINADDGGSDDSCTVRGRLADTDGDGDVQCGDPEVFRAQHNPQWLGPGAVLVADSENDRVVELHERGGEWRPVWVLTGADGRSFSWPRDADRLPNGNTLVTDSRGRRLVEVTESGETVWSYSTGDGIVYEADRLPEGETVGGTLYATDRPPETATAIPGATATTDGSGETTTQGPGETTTPAGTESAGTESATEAVTPVVVGGGGDRLPVFGEAARLLRAGLPWLPLWLRGPQVAVLSVSLLLVVVGVVDRRRR